MTKTREHRKIQNIWNKIWKDEKGQVVIWQMPNKWLIGWAGFTCLSLLVSGWTADVLSWIASGSLITWAALEITQGANYFRRVFGLVILGFSIATVLKSL
ncbi:MAG: hypothetical protein AAB436_04080 [Patescibacteria group bacterium]